VKKYLSTIWQKTGRKEFILLLSVVTVCICLWAFVEIAEEVGEGDHNGFEAKILKSLRRPDHPEQLRGPDWLAVAARDITALGGPATIVLITGLTTGYLLLSRKVVLAGFILVAIGGGFAVSVVLKHSFVRARPEVVPHLMPEFSSSFPSGHSMSSAVVYITLGALLARSTPRWRDKVYLISAALLLSGLIGISRVAMGVHYPTDVLAGWVAGTGLALICWTVAYWLQLHEKDPAAISSDQDE
jgi:undecaprenyl-diphosphatase